MITLVLMNRLQRKYGKRLRYMKGNSTGVIVTYFTRGGNLRSRFYPLVDGITTNIKSKVIETWIDDEP